ncbi:hypothetical protein GpartN1_g6940.t1 [Galdieria partita]|uniref:Sm domain-containing protein n=1 Tax=Galdieria partita TaxID=83374 RepID=A0A9C7Q2I2_9RHOD|nr:hypothetical protein GpartN1_g6086.t1 [Galdieria partita]GJQ15149.1 hypothetical protein GpartN1_g6940.t1 [Galdieria partita]
MSFLNTQKCDLTSVAFDPLLALKQGAHGTQWLEKVRPFDHLGQVKSILENPLNPLVQKPKDRLKSFESQPRKRARAKDHFFDTIRATLGTPLQALQFSKKDIVRVLLRDTHYLYGLAVGRVQAIDRHWNILLFDVRFKLIESNSDTISKVGGDLCSRTCPNSVSYDSLVIRGENVVSVCFQSKSN